MIKWADAHFAYKYGNGEKPIKKKKFGREHARQERIGWFRHFVSWLIGGALLVVMIFSINNPSQTQALFNTLKLWTLILVIDFIISFSYTLFPKKER
jgi:hypothetical protein